MSVCAWGMSSSLVYKGWKLGIEFIIQTGRIMCGKWIQIQMQKQEVHYFIIFQDSLSESPVECVVVQRQQQQVAVPLAMHSEMPFCSPWLLRVLI